MEKRVAVFFIRAGVHFMLQKNNIFYNFMKFLTNESTTCKLKSEREFTSYRLVRDMERILIF